MEQIIQTIKDLTGARFYFTAILAFLGFLAVTFKDEIRELNFEPKDLRGCSNEQGMMQKLSEIQAKSSLIKGYAVYLYQPKSDSYYKTLLSSNIPFVKENDYFKAIPLNAQKYLNYILINKPYVLLKANDGAQSQETTTQYNSPYVYVFNIYVKETIGEVIFTFDQEPSKEELELITKQLETLKYYII